jgi:hypothetical protein
MKWSMIPVIKVLPVSHWKWAQIPNLSRYLVLSRNKSQQHPQLTEIITSDPLIVCGCFYTLWKGLKSIYNFRVDCFP